MIKIITILALFFIFGCSKPSATEEPDALVEQSEVLKNLSAALETKLAAKISPSRLSTSSITLNEDEISALLNEGENAVQGADLGTTEDYILVMPVFFEAVVKAMGGLNKESAESKLLVGKITEAAVEEIANNKMALLDSSVIEGKTATQTALEKIPAMVLSNLDELGVSNLDVPSFTETLVESLLGNLGSSGIAESEVQSAVSGVTKASMKASENIDVAGFQKSELVEVTGSISRGATIGLGKMELNGYDSEDLPLMISQVVSTMVVSLGDLEYEGISSDDLPSLVEKITFGATSSLDELRMSDVGDTEITELMQGVTSSATSSLDGISMDGYDTDDYGDMIAKITQGSIAGIDQIDRPDFDSEDRARAARSISAGTTSSFDELDGVDSAMIAGLTSSVSRGASDGLSQFSSGDVDTNSIMLEVTKGTGEGLKELEGDLAFEQEYNDTGFVSGMMPAPDSFDFPPFLNDLPDITPLPIDIPTDMVGEPPYSTDLYPVPEGLYPINDLPTEVFDPGPDVTQGILKFIVHWPENFETPLCDSEHVSNCIAGFEVFAFGFDLFSPQQTTSVDVPRGRLITLGNLNIGSYYTIEVHAKYINGENSAGINVPIYYTDTLVTDEIWIFDANLAHAFWGP